MIKHSHVDIYANHIEKDDWCMEEEVFAWTVAICIYVSFTGKPQRLKFGRRCQISSEVFSGRLTKKYWHTVEMEHLAQLYFDLRHSSGLMEVQIFGFGTENDVYNSVKRD